MANAIGASSISFLFSYRSTPPDLKASLTPLALRVLKGPSLAKANSAPRFATAL